MKVVKRKLDSKIVDCFKPEYRIGFKEIVAIDNGNQKDYEEVEITQQEWDTHLEALNNIPEKLIKIKMDKLYREQAIIELKKEGKLSQDYKG